MSLFTEHFLTFRTGGWLVYLDVEVNLREEIKKITIVLKTMRMTDLFNMPVESAFLAEDVGAVGTDDAFHVVEPPHVRGQVGNLFVALRAGQVLQLGHVNLQSVDVEGGLSGELLITVRTFPHVGGNTEHWGRCRADFLRGFARTRTRLDRFTVWTGLGRWKLYLAN